MILTLVRFQSDSQLTLGKLYIDGIFQCFTLEDEFRVPKVRGETRIPAGSYRLELTYSPKFTPSYKHDLILVKDVPGFSGIRIHKGNFENETDGCILVGTTIFKNSLTGSGKAYNALYPILSQEINSGRPVWLAVIDHDRAP